MAIKVFTLRTLFLCSFARFARKKFARCFYCSKGNQHHRPKRPRQGGDHPQNFRPQQKTARYIEHPETETPTLPETEICSTQSDTQNFEPSVFTEFFEWLAEMWVKTDANTTGIVMHLTHWFALARKPKLFRMK